MCRISAHNKMSELLNRNTDPLFEKMEKIFDMNISEIPTDEMLIIMDKIKSDENSWIDKETVRALSERNIEKLKCLMVL